MVCRRTPQFFGKLRLGHVHVLAQSPNGILLPDNFAIFALDVVVGAKFVKRDGFLLKVNGFDMISSIDPGPGLEGTGGIAIAPPVFALSG